MKITSIRITKNKREDDTLLGIASIELDGCLIIHDIKLIQLDGKRFISFPNKKIKKYVCDENGYSENFEYTDIIHPSTKDFREYVESELFRIYDNEEVK